MNERGLKFIWIPYSIIFFSLILIRSVFHTNTFEENHGFLLLLYLLVAYFIIVNVHELGHVIIGKIIGNDLTYYRIAFLKWEKIDQKWTFSFEFHKGISGMCIMNPLIEHSRGQKFIFFLGGIVANIITGSIVLVFVIVYPHMSIYLKEFLLIVVWFSLANVVLNSVPNPLSTIPNDGENIKNLFLKRKELKGEV